MSYRVDKWPAPQVRLDGCSSEPIRTTAVTHWDPVRIGKVLKSSNPSWLPIHKGVAVLGCP